MNAATTFATAPRRAVSPYARRLAREQGIALDDLPGTGPSGRIVAVDVLAYQAPVAAALPELTAAAPLLQTFAFSATVFLADLYRLVADAACVGVTIDIEDAALRAARMALAGTDIAREPGIALEAAGRQIVISGDSGLSIGAERRLRLGAMDVEVDVSANPATASLLILWAARAVPVTMPIKPGRTLRLVLVVDTDRDVASALLCADADKVSETQALELLDAFVAALEEPLALMA